MALVHHDPVFTSAVTVTDASGHFEFKGVGAGRYLVTIDPPHSPDTAGSSNEGDRLVADGSQVVFAPIQVARRLAISQPGTDDRVASPLSVRWSAAEHATRYEVSLLDASLDTTLAEREVTATEATLSGAMTAGASYYVRVQAYSLVEGKLVRIGLGGVWVIAASTSTPAPVATTPTPGPSPAGTAVVSGSVRWFTQPLPNVRVRLVHQDPVFVSAVAVTDAEGRFRFVRVGAGMYGVFLDPPFPPEGAAGGSSEDARFVADGADVVFGPIQTTKAMTIIGLSRGDVVTSPVTVRWSPVDQATLYELLILDSSLQTVVRQETTASEATLSPTLSPGATYHVNVSAYALAEGKIVLIASGGVRVTAR